MVKNGELYAQQQELVMNYLVSIQVKMGLEKKLKALLMFQQYVIVKLLFMQIGLQLHVLLHMRMLLHVLVNK